MKLEEKEDDSYFVKYIILMSVFTIWFLYSVIMR